MSPVTTPTPPAARVIGAGDATGAAIAKRFARDDTAREYFEIRTCTHSRAMRGPSDSIRGPGSRSGDAASRSCVIATPRAFDESVERTAADRTQDRPETGLRLMEKTNPHDAFVRGSLAA